ncbi:laccase-13-like [Bidens hawaiensis]|uniref:laccase-13-like n=1 Tax=Bidens hawaiensis TaxID=980011 RepID=UPI004049CB46
MNQALFSGGAPNVSDAYTINGQPGDLYRCSSKDTMKFYVESGDRILFRVINSALLQQLFFTIANHELIVVAVDALYTKPFTTTTLMLGPGQSTDVILVADQAPGYYYIAARAYESAQNAPFDNTTTTAILAYKFAPCSGQTGLRLKPILPQLPYYNDTGTVTAFTSQLRSPSKVSVPTGITDDLFFTIGLGLINCSPGPTCQGPNNTRFTASMNNVSFVLPLTTSLLQAYYQNIPNVFTTDFPPVPITPFDYTGNVPRALWQPISGTKLYKLNFGAQVQIVLQDTAIVSTENHPVHLHGYQFYIVGEGFGNFDPKTDTSAFNLYDPPQRNTVNVPVGGWSVLRFVADNPGVWLMHCHIDSHLTWGFAMSFLVENGPEIQQSVRSPPLDLPPC